MPARLFQHPSASSAHSDGGSTFSTTHWTMVLAASGMGPQRDSALEQFAHTYWYPIYAFIRRRGSDPETAKDLTQEFFASLIEKGWLAGLDRRETRFSTFLLNILTKFLISEHRYESRQKRGGGQVPISIDMMVAENWLGQEPANHETPEAIFERRFAMAVLAQAIEALREEMSNSGKGAHFRALAPFLSREPRRGEYESIGESLRLSANAVAAAVLRLRRAYRGKVREEIASGLKDSQQVEEEMRHLIQACRGSRDA